MTRRDVRVGIAEYLGGSTLDVRGFYRPTPLASSGLSGVTPYYADQFEDRDYTDGLAAGATWGAIGCVHIAESIESRLAIGGILDRPYATDLYVWYQAARQSTADAQAAFDDLIEAIIARLRADPTLGGAVLQAGEGERGISTASAVPYGEPATFTYGSAVIRFNANTYPAG